MPGTLSASALARLTPTAQAQYAQQVAASQELQQALAQEQLKMEQQTFMRLSHPRWIRCAVQGGGYSATYAPNALLVFELPSVGGGFARRIKIHSDITLTLAAGASAQYLKTDSAPYSLYNEYLLSLGGQAQSRTHPFHASDVLRRAKGALVSPYGQVIAGNDLASLDGQLFNSLPVTGGQADEWVWDAIWDFNPLADDDPRGLIPLDSVGNNPTITLQCAAAALGVDPLQNALCAGTGTGQAVTAITGTVYVEVEVLDGENLQSTTPYGMSIAGMSTIQMTKEPEWLTFIGGALSRTPINSKLKHWFMTTIVIDGQSSQHFCLNSNIAVLELSKDATGEKHFIKVGSDSNLTVYDFFGPRRERFKQDQKDGVVVWIAGPAQGINDPSNRSGMQYLNMMDGGYPAATLAVQAVATSNGTVGLNPRLVTFLVSENPAGLRRTP